MEAKNEIITFLTSGVLILLILVAVLLYRNYGLSKKAKEESKA